MSEVIINTTLAEVELTTDLQANPVTLPWLGELVLLSEYWRRTGLLERLQTQVKVNRGRMQQLQIQNLG